MPDLAADLTFAIRAEMTRRGLRQKDVAAEVGTNDSTLTRLFHGTSVPDAATFARICLWLKADPAAFAVQAASEAYRRGRADQAAEVAAVLEGSLRRRTSDPEGEPRCLTTPTPSSTASTRVSAAGSLPRVSR